MQVNAKRLGSANDNALYAGDRRVIPASTDFWNAQIRSEFFAALWRFTEYQDYSFRRNRRHRQLLVILCRHSRLSIATLLLRSAGHFAFSVFLALPRRPAPRRG